MRSRALLLAAFHATAVAAVVALGLPAQGLRTPTPPAPNQRMIVAPTAAAASSPGTGPLAITLSVQGTLLSLGNATVAHFSDPTIPPPGSGGAPPSGEVRTGTSAATASGQGSSPGTVIVTFASTKQLTGNASRGQSCNSPLLALMCQLKLTVSGAGGQTTATYVMKGVNIASTASGSPAVITFAYKQIQYTFPPAP